MIVVLLFMSFGGVLGVMWEVLRGRVWDIDEGRGGRVPRLGALPNLNIHHWELLAEVGTDRIQTEAEPISGGDVIPLAVSGRRSS